MATATIEKTGGIAGVLDNLATLSHAAPTPLDPARERAARVEREVHNHFVYSLGADAAREHYRERLRAASARLKAHADSGHRQIGGAADETWFTELRSRAEDVHAARRGVASNTSRGMTSKRRSNTATIRAKPAGIPRPIRTRSTARQSGPPWPKAVRGRGYWPAP